MMICMRKCSGFSSLAMMFIAGLVNSIDALAYTPVTPPSWAGEPGRVRHVYLFPEDTATPSPDEGANTFGTPAAVVSLGPFAAGWQDPDPTLDVPESAGEPGSGAWDLGQGPGGSIRITVPIGNAASRAGFSAYRVKVKVNVVAYDVLVTLPSFSAENCWMTDKTKSDSLAFFDPKLGLWNNRTWTATLHDVREDHITLIISADALSGSTIDAIEIYAKAEEVLEPLYTALGTPIAWYRSLSMLPRELQTWDDLDYEDVDSDGMLNWQEYVTGTKPKDAASLLMIVKIRAKTGALPYLEWIGGTGGPMTPYVIESTSSLSEPDWQPIGTSPRVDGLNVWTGSEEMADPHRFYRIKAPRE
jgi:hypothetical protein